MKKKTLYTELSYGQGLLIMAFAALPERFFVFRNRFEPERYFR